ncbi:MAG: hypothetical protein V3W44_04170 [Dehalococcoidales bacterium]
MSIEDARLAAIGAMLDGEAVAAREIGQKVELSEMELIILLTMAQFGVYEAMNEQGITNPEFNEMRQELRREIDSRFSKVGHDGLAKLVQASVALLTQERLGRHVVTNH